MNTKLQQKEEKVHLYTCIHVYINYIYIYISIYIL